MKLLSEILLYFHLPASLQLSFYFLTRPLKKQKESPKASYMPVSVLW